MNTVYPAPTSTRDRTWELREGLQGRGEGVRGKIRQRGMG